MDNVKVSLLDQAVSFKLRIPAASVAYGSVTESGDLEALRSVLSSVINLLSQDGYAIDQIRVRSVPSPGTEGQASTGASSFGWTLDLGGLKLDNSTRSRTDQDSKHQTQVSSLHSSDQPLAIPSLFSLATLVSPFKSANERKEARKKRAAWERHIKNCRACQKASAIEEDVQEEGELPSQSGLGREKSSYAVKLLIKGMTCSSCVANVEGSVKELAEHGLLKHSASSDAKPLQVDLLSGTARGTLLADGEEDLEKVKGKLIESIEDAGYDVESVEIALLTPEHTTARKWNLRYSIGGMTCASCTGAVNSTVQGWKSELDDDRINLDNFDVDLLGNSASAKLTSKADVSKADIERRAREIAEAIGDSGYDSELISCEEEASDASKSSNTTRLVQLHIDGMFCGHCVEKVRSEAMRWKANSGGKLRTADLNAFSLASPLLKIAYNPDPHRHDEPVTMRHMIERLSALDDAFTVTYVPPPSLSSRSQELARKELISHLVRVAIAALFAGPALLVGVIAPAFLSPHHPLRQSLSQPIWGSATVGEIALWCLATPVQFGVGSVFYGGAWKSIRRVWRRGRSWQERLLHWGNMDVLVALGSSVAYFSSLAFLFVDASRSPLGEQQEDMGMSFFDACVFLNFFILLGRLLESWSKRRTGDAIAQLGDLKPKMGVLSFDGIVKEVPVEMLEIGDTVLIRPGASPPLDCSIREDENGAPATFNESSLTGEDRQVVKQVGDKVYTGTANAGTRAVLAQVEVLPDDCLIDGILEAVREASGRKAGIQRLADRVTSFFVPVIVYLSVVVLLIWIALVYGGALSDEWVARRVKRPDLPGSRLLFAIQFAVSTLVIACPCGIGLAAPTAQMVAIGLASKHGILVNGGGEAFSIASQVKLRSRKLVVLSDKTGTITKGEGAEVVNHVIQASLDLPHDQLHSMIAQAENFSNHPIALALKAFSAARASTDVALSITNVEEIAGKGLRAAVSGGKVAHLLIGNQTLMRDAGLNLESEGAKHLGDLSRAWLADGSITIFAAVQPKAGAARLAAAFAISDAVRPEAKGVFDQLKKKYDADLWIVTGDNEVTAKAVAKQVGISDERVKASTSPEGKRDCIEEIRQGGEKTKSIKDRPLILFCGDGVNDAPALASADVSIAMGSGSSIAHSSADFILLSKTSPLSSIETILSLSSAATVKIYSNFAWAAVFNVVLIPIAAGVLEPINFSLGPSWSGLAMALSSTSVVLSALTLNFWRPPAVPK